MQWQVDLLRTRPHRMCYHDEFGCSVLKGVGEPPELGSTETPLLEWEAWLTPQHTPLPHVTTSNLVVLGQTVYAKMERNPKNWEALESHPLWGRSMAD